MGGLEGFVGGFFVVEDSLTGLGVVVVVVVDVECVGLAIVFGIVVLSGLEGSKAKSAIELEISLDISAPFLPLILEVLLLLNLLPSE